MSALLLAVFVALMSTEALGTAVFLGLYLRDPGWRDTPVGRHLAWYSATLLVLYATSLLSLAVHAAWLTVLIVAVHFTFAVVIWQRVVLVWKARRPPGRAGQDRAPSGPSSGRT